jgi:hypothetical protein
MANSLTRSAALVAVAILGTSSLLAQGTARPPVVRDLTRELACSPHAAVLPPAPTLHIVGSEHPGKKLFGTGEAVIISGGSAQGIRVGQEYFVRRVVPDKFALPLAGFLPVSIHTAAWLRIVDVEHDMAIATISAACDGVLEGDYLEPFVLPVAPIIGSPGEPDYATAGVLVLGDERRQIGGAGSMMVLDRGTDHGVRPGQRATIFRKTLDGAGPVVRIAEAAAVIVRQDTSVIRIESSRDAVYVGDRVALHK